MADDFMSGGADEAAAAIQAIWNKDAGAPAAEPEHDEPVQAPEPAPVEAAAPAADEPEQDTVEEAPEGDTPDEPSQEETVDPVVTKAPEPAPVAAPKVAETPGKELATVTEKLTSLNTIVPRLEGLVQVEFSDVATYDDLLRLATEDPARYARYQIRQQQLTEARTLQAQASSEYRAIWQQSEGQKLSSQLPEWSDPVKGPALKQSLTAFAKEVGYTDAQIQMAGASDIILLRDAMMFRESKAKEATKAAADAKALKDARAKAADAPKVQKPGTSKNTDKGQEKAAELYGRFQKTGSIDDLAVYLSQTGQA